MLVSSPDPSRLRSPETLGLDMLASESHIALNAYCRSARALKVPGKWWLLTIDLLLLHASAAREPQYLKDPVTSLAKSRDIPANSDSYVAYSLTQS